MRSATLLAGLLLLTAGLPCAAQTSPSYRMTEHAFNAAGHPQQGTVPASTHFRMSLDAVGDAALARTLSSASYRSDGGFVSGYPPSGEVRDLRFQDKATLAWAPEASVGVYNVYRGFLPDLSQGDAGSCLAPGLAGETATDPAKPDTKAGFFYLVTAENRLAEEGTMGASSSGLERLNDSPCP